MSQEEKKLSKVKESGIGFRVIRGRTCTFCGGRTFLATLGPGKSAVRVCDSVTVVAELNEKIRTTMEGIAKIIDAASKARQELARFESLLANGGADLLKALSLKADAKEEDIANAVDARMRQLQRTIAEAERAAEEEIPTKEAEIMRLRSMVARTNEFCQAIVGWGDDRVVLPQWQPAPDLS